MAEVLYASRTLGTPRQLWSASEYTDADADGRVVVRGPNRRAQGLALELSGVTGSSYSEHFAGVERVSGECKFEEFRRRFRAAPSRPCVLTGGTHAWPAGAEHWSPESLIQKLGGDSRLELAGCDATVSLEDFARYVSNNDAARDDPAARDDEPAYVFETLEDGAHDDLVGKFTVPRQCTTTGGIHAPGDACDLLSAAGLGFGLHRWLLMGGPNSGSGVHVDPLGTSAWNTSLFGDKLWVLFPPDTPKAALVEEQEDEGGRAAAWFARVLPGIVRAVAEGTWPHGTPVRLRQVAGETVFVPQGWWHAVLNLTVTVAVTQNFADPENYPAVARAVYLEAAGTDAADEWRCAVAEAWPGLNMGFCVHCSLKTTRKHPLLEGRPTCAGCETALGGVGGEYERIDRQEAERRYAPIDLGADDAPPSFPRSREFLLSQVHEHAEDLHGVEEAELCRQR